MTLFILGKTLSEEWWQKLIPQVRDQANSKEKRSLSHNPGELPAFNNKGRKNNCAHINLNSGK